MSKNIYFKKNIIDGYNGIMELDRSKLDITKSM